jgi:hypothetical protein
MSATSASGPVKEEESFSSALGAGGGGPVRLLRSLFRRPPTVEVEVEVDATEPEPEPVSD